MVDFTTFGTFESRCHEAAKRHDQIVKIKDSDITSEAFVSSLPESSDNLPDEARARRDSRFSLLQGEDDVALERVLGQNDLMPINFLERTNLAANSVGRVHVQTASGRGAGFGTGFLIAPDLLMTNNHVLQNMRTAEFSFVEFDFEFALDGVPRRTTIFRFLPNKVFYTSADLDFTIVAVKERSTDSISLSNYAFLPLIKASGKALENEKVTIIQHPNGGPKQVALRDNRIIGIMDDFIHYETDTRPGSSGSPVLNDQMQVVALHHAGVPGRDENGKLLNKDHGLWQNSQGNNQILWVANEGVRISRIYESLRAGSNDANSHAGDILQRLENSPDPRHSSLDHPPGTNGESSFNEELAVEEYDGLTGFNPEFLGVTIPLPTPCHELADDVAPLLDGCGTALDYTHYSVMVSKSRKLAIVSAVNIDGNSTQSISRGTDRWFFDPRMSRKYQTGNALYKSNPLDRGHLVRRLDPVWGSRDIAKRANRDTFHWVNCAPQHAQLNQKIWLGLENYILLNAGRHDMKVSVFNGPVYRSDDMLYRTKYRIPAEYWKVVAFRKEDGTLASAAYLQTQKNLFGDLEFAFGQYKTFQVPLSQIENLTGLKFSGLENTDVFADEHGATEVKTERDIVL